MANKNQNVNVFRSLVQIIDEDNLVISKTGFVPHFESAHDYLLNRVLGNRYHFMPDIIFRTNKLKKTEFINFPLAWYSDEATCFLQALDGGIITLNKYLVNWRYSGSNISAIGNILERVKAGIDYQKWLETYISINGKLRARILSLNRKRVEQNKKNVLIRTARRNIFLGPLDILKNGLVVRQKFGMSYHLILMAILSFIKNYFRGKN